MTTSRTYYVTYSPRGFANELNVAEFSTKKEADEFRSEVENGVNSWTVPTDHPTHKSCVRNHKKEKALYGY